MKKNLIAITIFILFILICFWMDSTYGKVHEISQSNFDFTKLFTTIYCLHFIFTWLAIAYILYAVRIKDPLILANVLILIISALILTISNMLINKPRFIYEILMNTVLVAGDYKYQFMAYFFAFNLALYNLIRFNWHKLPFLSKSTEE